MNEFMQGHDDDMNNDAPLDEATMSVVRDVIDVPDEAIPREMMWARLQKQREKLRTAATPAGSPSGPSTVVSDDFSRRLTTSRRQRDWLTRVAGIAALLVAGIGVGRYLLPATGPSKYQMAVASATHKSDSIAALGLGPDAIAAIEPADDPAHVAMEEHLVQTVALLTSVRDDSPAARAKSNVSVQARELLSTTRLLLDEPQLRDERTRRLLQDLELVLVQIIQARGSAPETERAPNETMRETNLLPRVRAAVTATRRGEELNLGGDL